MAEDKDTSFKVTDRRKFNPDGTSRDTTQFEEAAPSIQPPAEPEAEPDASSARDNVVSFPGEPGKKREQAESQPPPEQASASGQAEAGQAGAGQTDAQSPRSAQAKAAASAAEQAYNQTTAANAPRMPEPTFLVLIDMLAGEAAMCLGMVKNPAGAEMPIDLDTARHLIDMLGMLQQKTSGNLTAEESNVLENMLAYLRMQFVSLSRQP
jgi:hypothetical protein